ncbi:site-specific integrase [Vibrio sp. JC009]|uniref:site-specific integrase n=1 Tax=Vibrio sp. JC009 TaxID=2912314 RepID=UPI0023B05624|nr:site-specific integrase [Vibrio sp. JC009]WED21574.1 site-specific integrase [Vibrio sp. JC009]
MKVKHPRFLPSQIRVSKLGYSFDMYSNLWALSKNITISFSDDVLAIDSTVLESFRKALARVAEELSAGHTSNMYLRFQRFIRDTNALEVDLFALKNWRAMLDERHEWYLGSLRAFLVSWHDWGYKGVSSEVVEYLESLRLKGCVKGEAVANRCPYTGAFTDNEALALDAELIRLFKGDAITLDAFTYIILLKATARRPIQLSYLKLNDIREEVSDINDVTGNKTINYKLNIPRAKQVGIGFREAMRTLTINEELYLTLQNLGSQNRKRFESLVSMKLSQEQIMQIPLFVDWTLLEKFVKEGLFTSEMLETDVFHAPTVVLKMMLEHFAKQQFAISERTGDVMRISARRFRRTRGTNLGKKGISVEVIAEALDHSDTQNAGVYTENTVETATYVDEIMGPALAPLAAAFKGKIIEEPSEGERGDDPSARIPNSDCEVVGACGTHDFCVLGYEACYLCDKFRPLLYAPHEKFLSDLYKEKEVRLKQTGSVQYASTKDRLILAVEDVVAQCNQMKQEREH